MWDNPMYRPTPITRALTLPHKKKRHEQIKINKRLVSNGLRPKYKV